MLRIRFYLTRLQLNLSVDMTGLVSRARFTSWDLVRVGGEPGDRGTT